MKNLLKQTVNDTEPKRSFSILVNDNKKIDETIVLVIHLLLMHNGLKLLFLKVVITLKI